MVVTQVDRAEVLEVAQVFLDNFHDVLAVKLGLNSLVRQLDPTTEQNQETI